MSHGRGVYNVESAFPPSPFDYCQFQKKRHHSSFSLHCAPSHPLSLPLSLSSLPAVEKNFKSNFYTVIFVVCWCTYQRGEKTLPLTSLRFISFYISYWMFLQKRIRSLTSVLNFGTLGSLKRGENVRKEKRDAKPRSNTYLCQKCVSKCSFGK